MCSDTMATVTNTTWFHKVCEVNFFFNLSIMMASCNRTSDPHSTNIHLFITLVTLRRRSFWAKSNHINSYTAVVVTKEVYRSFSQLPRSIGGYIHTRCWQFKQINIDRRGNIFIKVSGINASKWFPEIAQLPVMGIILYCVAVKMDICNHQERLTSNSHTILYGMTRWFRVISPIYMIGLVIL